jgi:FKBP-type peptidyl-prolyl cis-trans isomerase
MNIKRFLLLALIFLSIWSCKKDDGDDIVVVPPKNLVDVLPEDEANIKKFLETHFYNYEDFEEPTEEGFDYKIKIDTIAGENANKKSLMSQMTPKKVSVSANRFGSEGEGMVDHTYYYLVVREGVGEVVNVADSVYVRYEGSLLNGTTFDTAEKTPIWFDLANIQANGARGFGEGASNLKAGGEPIVNEDGTFSVEGYGIGLVVFPSGLGYYNAAKPTIPAYSPLLFKIEVFAVNQTDHDGDGIPSYMEDLNNNGYLFDDNTDIGQEEKDRVQPIPNFLDTDDDGDGTLTKEEIVIDANGNVSFPDTDNDGIPDYLDKDNK